MPIDKAGKKYWNDSWAASTAATVVDPRDVSVRNWANRQFHEMFVRLLARYRGQPATLLELGCAKSGWLPYFAAEFGFKVCGIDYSPVGAQMAREVLRSRNVHADIVCTDLFSPPSHMLGAFDVVISFGVAEHFEDTAAYVSAAAAYLKPGGMLITNIPNMVGLIGIIQKAVNRPVYDIHKLIDRTMLREAHAATDLEVLECDYFISTNFWVNNLAGISTRTISGFLKRAFLGVLARMSMIVWWVEDKLHAVPPNRITSPYINCVARKVK